MKEQYREVHVLGSTICYTDAYIYDAEDKIYMMSLFGRPGIVNAVSATIIASMPISIFFDGKAHTVKRSYRTYRIATCNFEGLCHKIIMADALFAAKDGPSVIAEGDKSRIFSFIDSRVSTPLKAEWANWLIDQDIVKHDPLISFDGRGKMDEAYSIFYSPDDEPTDEAILEGIREGDIK